MSTYALKLADDVAGARRPQQGCRSRIVSTAARVFLLGVVLTVAGCGSSASSGRTTTVVRTVTVVRHAKPRIVLKTRTVVKTVTRVKQSPTPARAAGSPAVSSGAGKVYSGSGDKSFGTILVHADSTLHWKCQCDQLNGGFYLDSDPDINGDSIDIQQSGSSGTTAVYAGSYKDVATIGAGQFSFYLSPG